MVDPVSIALFSGASLASMIVGRFSKNNVSGVRKNTTSSNLHFVNIKGLVDPKEFISPVNENGSIFLNIKSLFSSPHQLGEFLYNLEILAKRNNFTLKQITSELFLLAHSNQKLNVIPVKGTVNTPEIDYLQDQAISIMAS